MASSSPATGFEHFGHKIYSTVNQNNSNKNVFLSPASIALAMAMCSVGARQETLKQMLHVLDASSIESLTKTAEQVMEVFSIADQDTQVKLKLANRLYAQKSYKLQQDYLDLVQGSFKADIKLEDFVNNSAAAVQTINAWVEDQTNNLIQNLLSQNDVKRDTRLIIVNCIYFKGTWRKQFEEHSTNENADFHEASGNVSKVKLMFMKEKYLYGENKDLHVQIAHLPYKSDNVRVQFVFTVILPQKGVSLNSVEQKLSSKPQLLQQILNDENTRTEELLLYLPKFKMEASFELSDVLKSLGMVNAFSDSAADFTGIVSKEDDPAGLCVSKVIHKAFIDVNEKGTEAAAATAIRLTKRRRLASAIKSVEFKVDRPFIFMIRESHNNITFFSGKFLSPPLSYYKRAFRKIDVIFLDELGSEAAAATAVIMVTKSMAVRRKPEPIEFKADRPFLFYIQETRQNLTLFTGKFLTPTNFS
ncbi:unnamed protein product [Rotaria socialis]|uniref:Serpin domain-containing protein n=3 Tax=Rotaria socialis TaxID=392032 RepID=A0A820SXI6_9BILA|nr:unnamed protein product [Rotaria socialis]